MLERLRERLKLARQSVAEAEKHIQEVTERSPERLARQHLDQRQAELQQVELDIKLAELAQLDEEIGSLLQEKAALHQRIKIQLQALVPDMARLDDLEQMGTQLSSASFTLAHDTRQPLTSRWRDPKLSGAARTVQAWVRRLEGV